MNEEMRGICGDKEYTAIILDSLSEGVFTVDMDWRITSFNKAAEQITGVPREDAIGYKCCDVFRANVCESACTLKKTMDTGTSIVNQFIRIVRADGRVIPISVSTALLRDGKQSVIGGVELFRDLTVVEELKKELKLQHSFSDIVSKSHKMKNIFAILPQIAESDSTVLIEGESGTGKELIACAVHNHSHRRNKPCVIVNCGALPDTLLESELFGYMAGAFTDAKRDKPGKFARAEEGTIFLDEIGDISPAMQIKFLRVLQERTYEPLGSTKTFKANVRVITATNKHIEDLVEAGKFREDLYYRINVVRIYLPPLRERKEDIPLLVEHFIEHFNSVTGKAIQGITPDVLAIFMAQKWSGNIRELRNAIEFAFILCQDGYIGTEHLPDYLRPTMTGDVQFSKFTLREIEKQAIISALVRNNWKKMATAKELGIDKNTLRRKIKRYEISSLSP